MATASRLDLTGILGLYRDGSLPSVEPADWMGWRFVDMPPDDAERALAVRVSQHRHHRTPGVRDRLSRAGGGCPGCICTSVRDIGSVDGRSSGSSAVNRR